MLREVGAGAGARFWDGFTVFFVEAAREGGQ